MMLSLFLLACTPQTPATDTSATDTGDTGTTDTADTDTGTDTDTATGPTVERVSDVTGVVDAAPLPDGATFVFLGTSGSLCSVPADGSEVAACRSDLFSTGLSLVPSLDGERLYVAGTPTMAARNGEEPPFVVAAIAIGVAAVATAVIVSRNAAPDDESVSLVPGTEGHGVRAVNLSGSDIVFTGYAPDETKMGIFTVPAEGGTVETVVAGFAGDLSGIVSAGDGVYYAAGLDASGSGTLYEIVDGVPTAIVTGIYPGEPAGVALTPDGSTVLVSALSAEGTSQVILVNRETREVATFDEVIRANGASGGLHEATEARGTYAWADLYGGVYRVRG